MARAFVEHALDVRGERHVSDEVLREQPLAFVEIGTREPHPGFREPDIALGDFGEAQQLQRFQDGKQIIDLHLQLSSQRREIGATVVGFRRHCLCESGKHVG